MACTNKLIAGFRHNKPRRVFMRRILLSLVAASAIVSAASLAPANAMTVGTAPGVQAALADTGVVDEVVYVCRHRYYTSRRLCWWRPGYRYRHWHWRRWR
jgi:hypothetical protein